MAHGLYFAPKKQNGMQFRCFVTFFLQLIREKYVCLIMEVKNMLGDNDVVNFDALHLTQDVSSII